MTEENTQSPLPEEPFPFENIEIGIPTIEVRTKAFTAEAIEMYEMPSSKITEMLSVHGPRQMFKMMDLFKLAVLDPSKADKLQLLSFNELTEVVGQWASKSPMRWLEVGVIDRRPKGIIDPPLNGEDDDEDELYDFDDDDSFEWDDE